MCVPCRIWNFVWRTVCHKCGAPRGVSDDDWMEWETTDADPSEVSSGPEAPTRARRLFFPTRFSIESSHNLAEVLILNNNFFFFTDTDWLCVLCDTCNFVHDGGGGRGGGGRGGGGGDFGGMIQFIHLQLN